MILNHVVEGRGRRVLLLHPVGIDLTFLEPLAALLATRYRVMRMDLRGHGASALEPLAASLADFAGDVHETLVHTGFAPCTVVGFSFGGMVAQTLALSCPDDVAALVPCAGPCTQSPAGRLIAVARGTDALAGGMAVVLEAAMDRWFTPAFRASGGADAARCFVDRYQVVLDQAPYAWFTAMAERGFARMAVMPTRESGSSNDRAPAMVHTAHRRFSGARDRVADLRNPAAARRDPTGANACHSITPSSGSTTAKRM